MSEETSYCLYKDIPYHADPDLAARAGARCQLDVYHPVGLSCFTTILWLHGGGMVSGDRYIPAELMNNQFGIVGAGYRLAPQAKCPEYIEDAAAALAWVFKNVERYGGSPDRIVVGGSSAGAYLALLIALDRRWLAAHGVEANRLLGVAALSGQVVTHFTVREERGLPGHRVVVDELAPLHHVRADAPPILLVTGDRDLEILARYDENAYFARMLKIAGHSAVELHELKGRDHGGVEHPGHAYVLKFVSSLG